MPQGSERSPVWRVGVPREGGKGDEWMEYKSDRGGGSGEWQGQGNARYSVDVWCGSYKSMSYDERMI